MSHTDTLQRPSQSLDAEPPASPFEPLETIGEAIAEAADRNRELIEKGLKVWQEETARFIEDFSAQSSTTFGRLCDCKTPVDVLSVEQEWVRLRSHAYLESGLRFADAFSSVAQGNGKSAPGAAEAKPAPEPAATH